jgi:hypothetical protein
LTPHTQGLHVRIAISATFTKRQDVIEGEIRLWKLALGTLESMLKKANQPVGCRKGSAVLSTTFVPTSFCTGLFNATFASKPKKGVTRILVGRFGASNKRNMTDSTETHFNFLLASTAFS